MGAPEANTTLIYGVHIRESANDGSDFSNAAADYRVLFLGEDGKLHVKDSAGTVTDAFTTGSSVGNLWTMSQAGSSVTLTNGTDTTMTWDAAQIDGGGSVIDLANDRFIAPATGFYMAYATWLWEATAPGAGCAMTVIVGATEPASRVRQSAATLTANGGYSGSWPLSLTASDVVSLKINPGAATGVTARGNAAAALRTSFTLQRIT